MTIDKMLKEVMMSSYEYWDFIGGISDETLLKDVNISLDDINLFDDNIDAKDVIRYLSSNVNFERRDDRYYLSDRAIVEIKKLEENGMDECDALSIFLNENLPKIEDNIKRTL